MFAGTPMAAEQANHAPTIVDRPRVDVVRVGLCGKMCVSTPPATHLAETHYAPTTICGTVIGEREPGVSGGTICMACRVEAARRNARIT